MFALRANNFNRQGFLFHNDVSYDIEITVNQAVKFFTRNSGLDQNLKNYFRLSIFGMQDSGRI
jgi:hypothetical protein